MTREEIYNLADEVLANKCKSHVEAAQTFARIIKEGRLIDEALRTKLDETKQRLHETYKERDLCVALAAKLTCELSGLWPFTNAPRVGIGEHPKDDAGWEADWRTIVFIDLPDVGQLSWHVHESERHLFPYPLHPTGWDGHTTKEKYARITAYVAAREDDRPA